MPTPTTVGQVFELTIHMRVEDQEVLNILHFQTVQANSDVELRLLRAMLDCVVAFIPFCSTATLLEKVSAKRVVPDLGPIMEVSPGEAQASAGASAGDPHVSFSAALISKRTIRGGRSGLGRMFLGGIPEAATNGSKFNTEHAYWTAIAAFIACVVAKFIQEGEILESDQFFQLGVMSRKLGGAKPPYAAEGFARVVSLTPNVFIKSNVLRKVGRGS